jgi:hypothetical protein
MPHHKYWSANNDFTPGRLVSRRREYKIIRLLPFEGGHLLYRIKSAVETFERVAKESELAPRARML